MVTLLLVVLVAILCASHYWVYCCGWRNADKHVYRRYYRPLLRRHIRIAEAVTQGIVDDTATAQQKNVKLIVLNGLLRAKAIAYLLAYREATRHRRRKSKFYEMSRMVSAMIAVANQLDQARRDTARK